MADTSNDVIATEIGTEIHTGKELPNSCENGVDSVKEACADKITTEVTDGKDSSVPEIHADTTDEAVRSDAKCADTTDETAVRTGTKRKSGGDAEPCSGGDELKKLKTVSAAEEEHTGEITEPVTQTGVDVSEDPTAGYDEDIKKTAIDENIEAAAAAGVEAAS